ncbi:MmcQ/YjbR family DNA-binding protein [Pseudomonas typographi]|uniref:MmcQ/YjbR family DNA-binding protein n=1 Tax=Pseudomonas typographi TaxID=2715964 RepID=A0ABR7Z915_9PSED|nr:MmcQ/YjbR family DNA-binding protein [Pseudomonas typographi]MBD1554835.1 MmcQ/YjbR family DNA-binding protein [Pseudomonas typographi]MBD1589890.1 MmcQ/YjbR family DNA-binding protein [Pseudomonas typographi]MBD1601882.1 MmcQ/YjbR family DNA-binding protein [Pseudomonas typographi]
MTLDEMVRYCLSLPGAREDYKWGGVRVFSVAGTKMFAVAHLRGGNDLAFKVEEELFLGYCDRPGFRPAPYLARAKWVSVQTPERLSAGELRDLLKRSHQLVVARLPKRARVALMAE